MCSIARMTRKDAAFVQTIKTGVDDSGMTAVEGIHPGDVVATSGFDKLRNNSKVALSNQAISGSPSP